MTLENIVNVVITTESQGVSRKSFGIPGVLARHDVYTDLAKVYNLGTATKDMITDGFTANDPAYKAVQAYAANTPKAKTIVLGRLTTDFTHTFDLTVVTGSPEEGKVYAFTLVAPDGAQTAISYTALPGDDETAVALAVSALIGAVTGISATPTAAVIANTADNVNEKWLIQDLDISQFEFLDSTVDSSLVTDYTAIKNVNDSFYCVTLADPNSKVRVEALAAQIETEEKIFEVTTHDTNNTKTGDTTSVGYGLSQSNYFRTFVTYNNDQGAYCGSRWAGNRLPIDPGSSTWAYKPAIGAQVDVLNATQVNNLQLINVNYYIETAGAKVVKFGSMASGEWIDIIRGRDWLVARLRERIFLLLLNAPKVPYTDPGIGLVVAEVEAQMKEGIAQQYLAADPEPIVTAPRAAEVSQQNKIDRILPDVSFEAVLAGAIHIVDPLNGVLRA